MVNQVARIWSRVYVSFHRFWLQIWRVSQIAFKPIMELQARAGGGVTEQTVFVIDVYSVNIVTRMLPHEAAIHGSSGFT